MVLFSFSSESFNVDNIVNAVAYRKGWRGLSREINRQGKTTGGAACGAAPPAIGERAVRS
jgi:hypothetical protein